MERRERSYRGISARAAIGYLERLGGEQVQSADSEGEGSDDEEGNGTDVDGDAEAETIVEGEGWRAALSAEKVGVGPTLELSEVTVRFEGEPDVLEPLIEDFSQKAMRAGG
jgi:hypothetical protein